MLAKAAHAGRGEGCVLFACYLVGLAPGVAGGIACAQLGTSALGEFAPHATRLAAAALSLPLLMLARQAEHLSAPPKAVAGGAPWPADEGAGPASPDVPTSAGLRLAGRAAELAREGRLTPREEEVLSYLLAGYNRPYIRDHLHISLNTVGTHVKSIFVKLNVHSQQELLDLGRAPEAGGTAAR